MASRHPCNIFINFDGLKQFDVDLEELQELIGFDYSFKAKHLPSGSIWVVKSPNASWARKCIKECKSMRGGEGWSFEKVSGEANRPEINCFKLKHIIFQHDFLTGLTTALAQLPR